MDIKLICPQCESILRSGSQCYWHLRHEHELDHEEAFDLTGEMLEDNAGFERWKDRMRERYPGGDVATWINLPDLADE